MLVGLGKSLAVIFQGAWLIQIVAVEFEREPHVQMPKRCAILRRACCARLAWGGPGLQGKTISVLAYPHHPPARPLCCLTPTGLLPLACSSCADRPQWSTEYMGGAMMAPVAFTSILLATLAAMLLFYCTMVRPAPQLM